MPNNEPHENSDLADVEEQMRRRVEECAGQLKDALWEWAKFCRQTNRLEEARWALHRLIALVEDAEAQAFYYLSLGQLLEKMGDFDAAIEAYTKAFKREPVEVNVCYLIQNNLGYCLNRRGRHAEAEPHCRRAIAINPDRYNAHKNLGLSLQGQEKFAEAARCFVKATRLCVSDGRAQHHLKILVMEHPELQQEWDDLMDELSRS